ncbi:uncharacterized protein LOC123665841 [Melitaea cinxia]|uniref:uncharacterized protein LOC123665841 n=1 Tax=Melitaea cinxia TaxID=113334 RepID=UPI001E271FD9|nr:uncharacterized protein LOC123665841 [Melitaea cinxia]
MAGTRTANAEPPRSTAYYYADLEKIKRQNGAQENQDTQAKDDQNLNELSEYVETNEVINDVAAKEVPPLRDRWSPEYTTPENGVKVGETYSTAGTFPMPEPKEKEPLLAELEIVGRVPLTQLDTASGVRRSRSWYLCCPNVGDEEISRESSWRYSSLRPVTAPPLPGQNGFHTVATQSSGRVDDVATLRAERDSLARALAAEKQRAANAARAHDARLAELHGVIAELVRRRAADKRAKAIPEEEVSDECESTTQPAGELENDADMSQTEQNDNSSLISPAELPTPQDPKVEPLPDDTDVSTTENVRLETPKVEVSPPQGSEQCSSLMLSERDSEICVSTARCCQYARAAHSAGGAGSCERERGSPGLLPPSPGRCESREAKVASRVRLRRTEDTESNQMSDEEVWCVEAAERLALDVCAQADLREALVSASNDDFRLQCACAAHESSSVALCSALRAADRALEVYDVLLALQETERRAATPEREAAETVARRLLVRLEAAPVWGEPLLSPGPWQNHNQ